MDIATIITALVASGVAGLVSAFGTVQVLKVHINYLREDGEIIERRMTSAENRIGRTEIHVAELQTKTKGI